MQAKNIKQTTIYLDKQTHRQLKLIALLKETSVSKLVGKKIDEIIKESEKEKA